MASRSRTGNSATTRDLEKLFAPLAHSDFRRRFRLGPVEQRYLQKKGLRSVIAHAREFVRERLAPADPKNDGRQTPMRGHPAFIAQHATATCCRSCLAKWHGLEKGRPLGEEEVEYIVGVLAYWLGRQQASAAGGAAKSESRQQQLFD